MRYFVTSDLHIGHKKILEYNKESRPYASVEAMDNAIVDNWNTRITSEDTTYILGDVSLTSVGKAVKVLEQLNGKKILITGNHDKSFLKSQSFLNCFIDVRDYYELKYKGELFCMFHFPIESWNKKHFGAIHLHGHMHSRNPEHLLERKMDVGFDSNNCVPYNMDDIFELMQQVPIGDGHHV